MKLRPLALALLAAAPLAAAQDPYPPAAEPEAQPAPRQKPRHAPRKPRAAAAQEVQPAPAEGAQPAWEPVQPSEGTVYLGSLDGGLPSLTLALHETATGLGLTVMEGQLPGPGNRLVVQIGDQCPPAPAAETSGVFMPAPMGESVATPQVGEGPYIGSPTTSGGYVGAPYIESPVVGAYSGTPTNTSTEPDIATSTTPSLDMSTGQTSMAALNPEDYGYVPPGPPPAYPAPEGHYAEVATAPWLRFVEFVPTDQGFEAPGLTLGEVLGQALVVESPSGRLCGQVYPSTPAPQLPGAPALAG